MKNIFFFLVVIWFLQGCSSSESYKKSPADMLARDRDKEDNFTIILYDMDVEGSFSSSYKHRYKVIVNKKVKRTQGDSTYTVMIPKEKLTDWYEVSKEEFDKHVNDMGMEIISKKDGKLSKQTAPPGYSNYVGNSQYGEWKTGNNGTSFWHFYGQYAFISSMMGLATGPIYRNSYNDYTSHRNTGRSYYGTITNGRPSYGTHSSAVRKSNPDFYSRYNSKGGFRNKVNNSVSRSPSTSSRYRGNTNSSSSSRKSRSSSRYGGSSRSRSFSGGGK